MSETVTLRVLRSDPPPGSSEPYSVYEIPHFPNMDVLDALRYVRENLDPSLGFRAACGEGKCGLCGVLVDGKPALACKKRLQADQKVTLDPLPGFPIVRDLFVDRTEYYAEERALLSSIESPEPPDGVVAEERHDDYVAFKDCTECSLCTASCPSAPALDHPHAGPPGFLQAVRAVLLEKRGTPDGGEELYRCFLCGQCVKVCPRDVPVTLLNRRARGAAAAAGLEPDELRTFLSRLVEQRVVATAGGHGTAGWLRVAPAEVRERVLVRAPLGLFVGCQFGLRSSRNRTPVRLAHLLLLAGVEFTLLGEEEWCCGHPHYLAGDPERMREFAQHNVAAFRRLGVREVIAACPGCYTAWASEYAEVLGEPTGIAAQHTSQALLRLLEEKRLFACGSGAERAVYHDPCELGRLNAVYDAPRQVLRLAGATLVELGRSREGAHCCGAGGLTLAAAPEVARQATHHRLEEILKEEPGAIVTACPNCETTLETALRLLRRKVRVLDIVDVLSEAVIQDR